MKTNLDSLFKTNRDFEIDGVDFAINDKTSFRVRRFNDRNPNVKAAHARYYKPYARQIEMKTMSPEKAHEITIKLFIDVCLVSWEGVENEDGTPIECTKENALNLFKSLPDLFSALWEHANDFENYREDVGNFSSAISDGPGAGEKN